MLPCQLNNWHLPGTNNKTLCLELFLAVEPNAWINISNGIQHYFIRWITIPHGAVFPLVTFSPCQQNNWRLSATNSKPEFPTSCVWSSFLAAEPYSLINISNGNKHYLIWYKTSLLGSFFSSRMCLGNKKNYISLIHILELIFLMVSKTSSSCAKQAFWGPFFSPCILPCQQNNSHFSATNSKPEFPTSCVWSSLLAPLGALAGLEF